MTNGIPGPSFRQSGLTLVELMISLLLGLLIAGAASYIFVSSTTVYRTGESVARMQENARTAFELLQRDIRQGGFLGCLNVRRTEPTYYVTTPPPLEPFRIFPDGQGWTNTTSIQRVPGTDVLVVRWLPSCVVPMVAPPLILGAQGGGG